MPGSIFLRTFADFSRPLIVWAAGLSAYMAMIIAFFPYIETNPGFEQYVESFPDAIKNLFGVEDLVSPAGFLTAEIFSLMAPIFFLIYGIGRGTYLIAGEEENKTLDLTMAHPVPRGRFVIERFLVLLVSVVILSVAIWLTMVITAAAVSMDIRADRLAAASLNTGLLTLAFGTLALALGAITGRKALTLGICALIAAAGYFLYSFAPLVQSLEDFRVISPFYYYLESQPLVNGFSLRDLAVLGGSTLLFLAAAWFGFQRRDLAR